MSGIYIHIPFCSKKCFYCDFYTNLSIKYKNDYLKTLIQELKLRQSYLINTEVKTIYFGGGTPSLLSSPEIQMILDEIYAVFKVSRDAEITLEANPDDLTESYIKALKSTDINRLSVGLQSFFDDDLLLMNRRHNAKEIYSSIKLLQDIGYNNLSGDLIYGLPNSNIEKWQHNIEEFFKLEINHLSAYHLTYEPNTVFSKYLKTGKIKEIKEDNSLQQFEILKKETTKQGFIHYETSNFAKQGFFSKHNMAYWQQKPYLGLGVSAHSYNLKSRQYNIANLKKYMKGVGEGGHFFEKEELTANDQYNDYLITTLRTMWGTNLNYVKENFGQKYYSFIQKESESFIEQKLLIKENNILKTTAKGKFVEDMILEKLFIVGLD